MKKDELLYQLFLGELNPCENLNLFRHTGYVRCMNQVKDARENLETNLLTEKQQLLEELEAAHFQATDYATELSFVEGFKLGAMMILAMM